MDHMAKEGMAVATMEDKRRFPLWVSNLLVFGFLCAIAVGYFLWQVHATRETFFSKMKVMTELVARIIELNARGAMLSQQTTEEILYTFLGNTARFVDYLDAVEPFNTEELTQFAKEARLSGISILKVDTARVEGPSRWVTDAAYAFDAEPRLAYFKDQHLYIFSWPRQDIKGRVVVGIEAATIESLQNQLGLPAVIETITRLPGISYIRTTPAAPRSQPGMPSPGLLINERGRTPVAESRFIIDNQEITIGLDASPLSESVKKLRRDFMLFSGILVSLGALLSFLLYRQQSRHVEAIRVYERKMSEQREDAALGRTAASIAHEIRNPLNSLSMGLQRLHMEGTELAGEHRHFIEIMLDAVHRANSIVTGLLDYASPHCSSPQPVRLDLLIANIIPLYQARCAEQGITLTTDVACMDPVSGDQKRLSQVVENLLKNAVEAQPNGGFITIAITRAAGAVVMDVTNGGFTLSPEQAERITEPYFTTKPSGTGLGLAIARRIITAHGGELHVQPLPESRVRIGFHLPVFSGSDSHHSQENHTT
jgi:signal transduction histidine kinase